MKNFDKEYEYLAGREVEHTHKIGIVVGFSILLGCTIVDKNDTTRILVCISRDLAKRREYSDIQYYDVLDNILCEILDGTVSSGTWRTQSELQDMCPFNS